MQDKLLNYFNGDDLASSVWLGKYAQENETHYDQMHRRLAKEFARIENKYNSYEFRDNSLSKYGKIRKDLDEETIPYRYMIDNNLIK